MTIPPLPAWDSLHPLIVHFPIALLLVAPIFIVIGAAWRGDRGRPYLVAALLLMLLGTAGAWLASATGEAAKENVAADARIGAVLDHHKELAEATRAVFTTLTAVLAAILFLPRALRRDPSPMALTAATIAFLLAYTVAALLLANTAQNGGKLVHELGTSSSAQIAGDDDR